MFKFFYKNSGLLFIGFLTAFGSGFGQTYFISLFGGYFRELLNLTNGEFGSYYSIATILSAISLIWAGKLIDNIELRKYVVAIVIGLSLTCLLVSSIINVYMLFISLYFLVSIFVKKPLITFLNIKSSLPTTFLGVSISEKNILPVVNRSK